MAGEPVAGKKVIAFTWPEPHFHGLVTVTNINGHKLAWLDNDVSEESDADGYATFTNLTIKGSNSRFVYIFFTCDGATVTSWSKEKEKTYIMYDLPYYVAPI